MDYIITFTGEEFEPLAPDTGKIKIEDIAHALSLMCRANGHVTRFFSVAQHCINCANEAKARGYSTRVQLICLLHDASEAYLSDITRPVKKNLPQYREIEKQLQDTIYMKFLGAPLSDEERSLLERVDNDMLIHEFNALMEKKVYDCLPIMYSVPSFEIMEFSDVEKEFAEIYEREVKNNGQ